MCGIKSHIHSIMGMDKQFHSTYFYGCNYLHILRLKLAHLTKRDPCTTNRWLSARLSPLRTHWRYCSLAPSRRNICDLYSTILQLQKSIKDDITDNLYLYIWNVRNELRKDHISGLILGLHPANERRRYKVTPSLIGWAQTWNHPCIWVFFIQCQSLNCMIHLEVHESLKLSPMDRLRYCM